MRRKLSTRLAALGLAASTLLLGAASTSALATGDSSPTPATVTSAESPEAAPGMLTVVLTRTDNLGDQLYVGDRMTFTITYTNNTDNPITAFPKDSNLEGMLTNSSPNCRWSGLPARTTKQCTSAFHIVTAEDVEAGTFVPASEWKATKDRNGNIVLQDGIRADAPPVEVVEGERPPAPDPLETPRDYEIGDRVRLAQPGDASYACHRIPALTQANNGWILAAWDGRPGGCADAPQANSIVYRISKDGGKSWTRILTALRGKTGAGKYGYSDPSFVVDRETGTIFLFSVYSLDQGIGGSVVGTDPTNRNIIHAHVVESRDNGETWTNPRIITADVAKGHEDEWRSRFASSGEGIQVRYGKYRGRLIQQYAIQHKGSNTLYAHSVYSDDHGKTWQHGELTQGGADENKVVELSDGTLLLNSRSQSGGSKRLEALSYDGGHTWSNFRSNVDLIDPTNNASIIRAFPNAPKDSARAKILLFSNAKHGSSRANGYVRISYNNGFSWTSGRQFEPGAMAYSTLTPLNDGTWGLLYESGGYRNIEFMKIDVSWLGLNDPGEDPATTADAGTQTEGTPTSESGTQTDPTPTADAGTQTDPKSTAEAGSQTENPTTSTAGTQTEGTSTSESGTQTESPTTGTAGTQTENPTTGEAGSQTEATSTSEAGTGTEGGPAPLTLTLADSESTEIPLGTEVTLRAENFAPGEEVTFTLHSEPRELATVRADGDGVATATVVIDGVEPGEHTITAGARLSGDVSFPVTIVEAPARATSQDAATQTEPVAVPEASGKAAESGKQQPATAEKSATPSTALPHTGASAMNLALLGLCLAVLGACLFASVRTRASRE